MTDADLVLKKLAATVGERVRADIPAGLRALVLFGSRARADSREDSDWDFGYLGSPEMDAAELSARLSSIVGSDRIDVVDLERASGLLRIRAASEGILLWQAGDGVWHDFQEQAARFWCDAEPVLRSAYDQILSR